MIAISSLFERLDPCPDVGALGRGQYPHAPNENHQEALDWYSRAVSAVRHSIERGGMDAFVGLITCVLFICVETLLGGVQEALRLYGQDINLIHAYERSQHPVPSGRPNYLYLIPCLRELLQLELAFNSNIDGCSFVGEYSTFSLSLDLSLLPRLSKLCLSHLEQEFSLLLIWMSESIKRFELEYSSINSADIFPRLGEI